MPPPIPINPERNPIDAPINNDRGVLDIFCSLVGVLLNNKNLATGMSNNNPNIFLYKAPSNINKPPTKAIGMEAKASGKNIFFIKYFPL